MAWKGKPRRRVTRPTLLYWPLAGRFLAAAALLAVFMVTFSAYLIVHDRLGRQALAAVAIVAVLVHPVARPVPGPGITVPVLLPGLFAVLTAFIFRPAALARLAHVGGALGTLTGPDPANLGKCGA